MLKIRNRRPPCREFSAAWWLLDIFPEYSSPDCSSYPGFIHLLNIYYVSSMHFNNLQHFYIPSKYTPHLLFIPVAVTLVQATVLSHDLSASVLTPLEMQRSGWSCGNTRELINLLFKNSPRDSSASQSQSQSQSQSLPYSEDWIPCYLAPCGPSVPYTPLTGSVPTCWFTLL